MSRILRLARTALAGTALGAALLAAAPARAATTQYALNVPPSSFVWGCGSWGPCACPEFDNPTYGSFELTEVGSDPLYTYYTVERYIASFSNGPGAVALTGSGTYKIGGEVALTQQMTLDLSLYGGPVQHFDSGVVPLQSATFPAIHVACAAHGFACYDTVVTVDAKPSPVAGGPPAGPPRTAISSITPNPFAGTTSIVFTVDGSGPVTLTVVDLAGRRVRTLLAASRSAGGPGGSLTWDGRRDDGTLATTGVYWLHLATPRGSDTRRLIKIE